MSENDSIDSKEYLKIFNQIHNVQEHSQSEPSEVIKRKLEETGIIVTYSAAAVGSSIILLFIPNLETISFFIFFVSFLYGFRVGLQMMLTTAIIFELFATLAYGFGGWLLLVKISIYFIYVLVGHSLHKRTKQGIYEYNSIEVYIFYFILGYSLTLLYDIITTLSYYLIIPSFEIIIVNFILGIPYILFHEITNGIQFSLVPKLSSIIQQLSNGNYT